jgi:hypothetical protein
MKYTIYMLRPVIITIINDITSTLILFFFKRPTTTQLRFDHYSSAIIKQRCELLISCRAVSREIG